MLNFVLRNILFPLVPFFSGFLIRYVYIGNFNIGLINPAELSYSMALLSILMIISSTNIDNRDHRDNITIIFIFSLIIFLLYFIISHYLQYDMSDCLKTINDKAQLSVSSGGKIDNFYIKSLNMQINKSNNMLNNIRFLTIWFAISIIPISLIIKYKYL